MHIYNTYHNSMHNTTWGHSLLQR